MQHKEAQLHQLHYYGRDENSQGMGPGHVFTTLSAVAPHSVAKKQHQDRQHSDTQLQNALILLRKVRFLIFGDHTEHHFGQRRPVIMDRIFTRQRYDVPNL